MNLISRRLFCIICFLTVSNHSNCNIDDKINKIFTHFLYETNIYCREIRSLIHCQEFYNSENNQSRNNLLQSFCFLAEYQPDSILHYLNKAGQIDDPRLLGLKNIGEARLLSYQGEYLKAIRLFSEALEHLDQDKDQSLIALAYLGIGVTHYRNFTFDKAKDHLTLSLSQFEINNDTVGTIESVDWLAHSFSRLGHYDKADSLWQKFHYLSEYVENDLLQFYNFSNKAFSFNNEAKYDSALVYLHRADQLINSTSDTVAILESLLYLIECQQNLHHHEDVRKIFRQYQFLPDKYKSIQYTFRVYKAAAKSAAIEKNYSDAYTLFTVYDSLYHTYWQNSTKQQIIQYETQYETERKNTQIAEQALKIQKYISQRNLAYFLITSIILLTGFVVYNTRRSNKLTQVKLENIQNQKRIKASNYIIQGQQEERRRIAQDLHDGIGGLLATAKFQLQKIYFSEDDNMYKENNQTVETIIKTAHQELRKIAHNLMPSALMELGLEDAIEDYLAKIQSDNLEVSLNLSGCFKTLSDNDQINIFRIIQEICNNTKKHSMATKLKLEISELKSYIRLKIWDNGIGFNFAQSLSNDGLGLKSIMSRVDYLKGSIKVDSHERGSHYLIKIPLD